MSSNPTLRKFPAPDARPAGMPGYGAPSAVPGSPTPFAEERQDVMTTGGVIAKSGVLIVLVAAAFLYTWDRVMSTGGTAGTGWMLLGGVTGFIVSLVISFKPTTAPFLAPVFAIVEGLFLGGISAMYEQGFAAGGYEGIVFQAGLATISVFVAMLMLFRSRLVRVTERFRSIVSVAMLGVVIIYALSFVLSFAGIQMPLINDASPLGIGFSLLVIGIASAMLLVDFDTIERGVAAGAPKYMEWYGAFALLVTVVWIYLEILRLLSKLNRR